MIEVAIEGIDGCGKTTLINFLKKQNFDEVFFEDELKTENVLDSKELDQADWAIEFLKYREENYQTHDVKSPCCLGDTSQTFENFTPKLLIRDRSVISSAVYQSASNLYNPWYKYILYTQRNYIPDYYIYLNGDWLDIQNRYKKSDKCVILQDKFVKLTNGYKKVFDFLEEHKLSKKLFSINTSQNTIEEVCHLTYLVLKDLTND